MTTQPSKAPMTVTGEWECTECGYIEEGSETRRPAECPECGAPSASLEFYAYEADDDWEDDMDELGLLDADDEDVGDDYVADDLGDESLADEGVGNEGNEEFEDEEDAF